MCAFLYFSPRRFFNCSNLGGNCALSFGCQNFEIAGMGCVIEVGLLVGFVGWALGVLRGICTLVTGF